MAARSVSPGRVAVSAAAVLGLLATAATVWQSSRAAFFAETGNSGNAWSSGTVSLTDNSSSAALFAASGVRAGDSGTACITVAYGGSVDAAVRLYIATGDLSGALVPYLDLTVEQGTNTSTGSSCTGFTPTAGIYTGAMADFAAASRDFATGAGAWSVAGGSNASRGYRFTWTLRDDNAAQGKSARVKFTWEARNT